MAASEWISSESLFDIGHTVLMTSGSRPIRELARPLARGRLRRVQPQGAGIIFVLPVTLRVRKENVGVQGGPAIS